MAKFNWGSINAKVQLALNSDSVKTRIYKANSGEISQMANNAAEEFISTIKNELDSAGFSEGQKGVLSSWGHGGATVNINDGTATITVSSSNPAGVSLYEQGYGSVDLTEVFSRGHTPSTYVYGEWRGAHIRSSLSLTYSDFIDSAIGSFSGHAGSGYTVISISRGD